MRRTQYSKYNVVSLVAINVELSSTSSPFKILIATLHAFLASVFVFLNTLIPCFPLSGTKASVWRKNPGTSFPIFCTKHIPRGYHPKTRNSTKSLRGKSGHKDQNNPS